MNIKHLFFDLDRTLWDFEANSQRALDILYHQLHLERFTNHFIQFHEVYKAVNHEYWERYAKNLVTREELRNRRFIDAFEKLGIHDVALANEMSDGYLRISPDQTQLFPNTVETLETLKNQGFSMSIITNGFSEVQFHKLENTNIRPFFQEVICSEMVGKSKPNREIFDFALQKVNVAAENCVMIGDDINGDVLGAEAVGMTGILFNPDAKKLFDKSVLRIKNLDELPFLLSKLSI